MVNYIYGMTIEERIDHFWSKVDIKGIDECWNWKAGQFKHKDPRFNCGCFRVGDKQVRAPRFALSLKLGRELLTEEFACHDCPDGDNPLCVNPSHLYLGNSQTNMDDRVRKGRCNAPAGEDHPLAKMTEEKVVYARAKYKKGKCSIQQLADELEISKGAMQSILQRINWRHI